MHRKFTKSEIEKILIEEAGFHHEVVFMNERELLNERVVWNKDGSVSVKAKQGGRVDEYGAPITKKRGPRLTIGEAAADAIDASFH